MNDKTIKKPLVLVLDDEWKHPDTREPIREPYLREWIGDLVDLEGISFYTLPSLRRRELGEGRTPHEAALKQPSLILLDLDILKDGTWSDGINYLFNTVQQHPLLRDIPVVIISTYIDAARPLLRRSGIPEERAFDWGQLVDNAGARNRFRALIAKLVQGVAA